MFKKKLDWGSGLRNRLFFTDRWHIEPIRILANLDEFRYPIHICPVPIIAAITLAIGLPIKGYCAGIDGR